RVVRPIDFVIPDAMMIMNLDNDVLDETDPSYKPSKEESATRQTLLRKLARHKHMLDNFWTIWTKDYLSVLRDRPLEAPMYKKRGNRSTPQPGDVVIVIDETGNTPRYTWPLARVLDVHDTHVTLLSSSR